MIRSGSDELSGFSSWELESGGFFRQLRDKDGGFSCKCC